MQDLIFPLPVPALPIHGLDARFPVGRIFCVGRNYAAHAREMGADPHAEPPIFFMKPASAAMPAPSALAFPFDTADLHHEVELVLALHRGGQDIAEADALSHVYAYGVGVDLTKRDRQAEAKSKGQPWERSKAFDGSAPVSVLARAETIGHPRSAEIALSVDGAVRQHANIADMIWPPQAIIAKLSTLWRLAPGDLIFTGTPEGVGAIAPGARIQASVAGVANLDFTIGSRP
jgi:fumarylpyruvate hydrolase